MASDKPPDEKATDENDIRAIREKKISAPLWEIANHVGKINTDRLKREQDEKDYKNHSLRWMKGGVISSTFFALLSAGIAFLTYTILKNQTTILENQSAIQAKQFRAMQIDQRAWLNIKFKPDQIEAGKPIRGTLKVTNTGKTPAKKVAGTASLQKVASDKSPKVEGLIIDTVFSSLIPPGSDLVVSVTGRDGKSPVNFTKTDLEELRSGKAYIAVIGKFGFVDIYDTPHWIKFCLWKDYGPGTYSAAECVNHNETDTD